MKLVISVVYKFILKLKCLNKQRFLKNHTTYLGLSIVTPSYTTLDWDNRVAKTLN